MKLASIEVISGLVPHPNADRLDLARVLGWQVVVRKGEFQVGDRAVFIPIDTLLPSAPWSEFLKDGDKPIRLKTVKLRGQHSQGLLLPLSVLPEHVRLWQDGADVGAELGVKKYEKEVSLALSGVSRGSFPQHLAPRTDEDNGLSNPDLVAEVLRYPVQATVKLDGSSCTIIVRDWKIDQVCSRNQSLVESDSNAFWAAAKRVTPPFQNCVIQGELMGPGIQGNQLGLPEPTLFVYQIRMDNGRWVTDPVIFRAMDLVSVQSVPAPTELTLPSFQALADSVTVVNTSGETIPAEGIVVRPINGMSAGNGRPLGFKIINRNYKD